MSKLEKTLSPTARDKLDTEVEVGSPRWWRRFKWQLLMTVLILGTANLVFFQLFSSHAITYLTNAPVLEPSNMEKEQLDLIAYRLEKNKKINEEIKIALNSDQPINEKEEVVDEDESPTLINQSGPHEASIFSFTNSAATVMLSNDNCAIYESRFSCYLFQFSWVWPLILALFVSVWVLIIGLNKQTWAGKILYSLFVWMFGLLLFSGTAVGAVINIKTQIEIAARDSLNQMVTKLNNPSVLIKDGFLFSSQDIANKVKSNGQVPKIVVPDSDRDILNYYLNSFAKLTYVEKYVMPSIMADLSNSHYLNVDLLLLPNNNLIAKSFNSEDLQILLPVFGKYMIAKELRRYDPVFNLNTKLEVLGSVDYHQFQLQKRNEREAAIQKLVGEVKTGIAEIKQVMNENNHNLGIINQELDSLDDKYDQYVGDLQATYDQYCTDCQDVEQCQELKSVIEVNKQKLDSYEADLYDTKAEVELAQSLGNQFLSKYQESLDGLEMILQILQDNPVSTEYEYGAFFPGDNRILVKYADGIQKDETENMDRDDSEVWEKIESVISKYQTEPTLSEYVSTAVHEYLHAITFEDEENTWPMFMEEGVTEYLSTLVMEPYVDEAEDLQLLAYSNQISLLDYSFQLLNREQLFALYFSDKSPKGLEKYYTDSISDFDYEAFELTGEAFMVADYTDMEAIENLRADLEEMFSVN